MYNYKLYLSITSCYLLSAGDRDKVKELSKWVKAVKTLRQQRGKSKTEAWDFWYNSQETEQFLPLLERLDITNLSRDTSLDSRPGTPASGRNSTIENRRSRSPSPAINLLVSRMNQLEQTGKEREDQLLEFLRKVNSNMEILVKDRSLPSTSIQRPEGTPNPVMNTNDGEGEDEELANIDAQFSPIPEDLEEILPGISNINIKMNT